MPVGRLFVGSVRFMPSGSSLASCVVVTFMMRKFRYSDSAVEVVDIGQFTDESRNCPTIGN